MAKVYNITDLEFLPNGDLKIIELNKSQVIEYPKDFQLTHAYVWGENFSATYKIENGVWIEQLPVDNSLAPTE